MDNQPTKPAAATSAPNSPTNAAASHKPNTVRPTATSQAQQDDANPTSAPENTLLDTALQSGKKWIEDSGILNQANQLPQQLKSLGNRAAARVNDLSTTQKVVGGTLLAVGLGWLATRVGRSSAVVGSNLGDYGRQGSSSSFGRSNDGYQVPGASMSRRFESGISFDATATADNNPRATQSNFDNISDA